MYEENSSFLTVSCLWDDVGNMMGADDDIDKGDSLSKYGDSMSKCGDSLGGPSDDGVGWIVDSSRCWSTRVRCVDLMKWLMMTMMASPSMIIRMMMAAAVIMCNCTPKMNVKWKL